MVATPNGFGDRDISLYSSKIVDNKELLRTVSNTDIYCSSVKVGTVYLVLSTTMHSATHVRTWRVARLYSVLYSEIALSRKPFGTGHMYIYNFLLRMAYIMTSENVHLSSWDILQFHLNIFM
jgi:hypothetical protein